MDAIRVFQFDGVQSTVMHAYDFILILLSFVYANASMNKEALSTFHPAVAGWFRSRFPELTEAQRLAWEVTSQHRNALIAAPTGSGKTLAAFLSAINALVVEKRSQGLSDEVQILYVSPMKALSNDIQKILQKPLAGIRDQALEQALPGVPIRNAVRSLKGVQEKSQWEIRNLLTRRQGPGAYLPGSAALH